MRPEFVDNRDGNTLALALRGHLEWLRQTRRDAVDLSIASGYFNPEGFACLAEELEQLRAVRLLLGAEPTSPPARRLRKPGEPRGGAYNAAQVDRALRGLADGLRGDRDLMGFDPEADATLRRMIAFLRSGRIEVRRYEKAFLHGKAFVFADDEGVLSGSSNFTGAGLTTNLELNLGRYDPTPVAQVKRWLDELWEEAAPYDLAAIYEARFEEYDPYLIYLRILWELYGEELEEERQPNGALPLTTFQNDGIFRAQRILQQFHGVLIADGVGLGKTFLAGELLREAVQERRQRVLLIAPAALRDGTWRAFQNRFQLFVETVSFEQLMNGQLACTPNEYALVVVDEAAGFRNPNTRRAEALRQLLVGDPPKDLVLLSATPVNNSLWDLYYLLTYFVGQDAAFASRGIRSLRERFVAATREDPYELRPDMLFDVLDMVAVRRTRHFVRRYYRGERVQKLDGTWVPVQFPRPRVHRVEYEFGDALSRIFQELRDALAPEDEDAEPALTMARYAPSRYTLAQEEEAYEVQLVGLLRSALLKRFESSVYAFGRTVRKMMEAHDRFLRALAAGYVPGPKALAEVEEVDTDEALEQLLAEGDALPASEFDAEALERDVRKDRALLERLAEMADQVTRGKDPKLAALMEELADLCKKAEKQGVDEEDRRNRRKVLIFSYFADTVEWIEEHLREACARDPRLACYAGRIASVTSDDSRGGVSRSAAIYGFAPVSTEAPPAHRDDRFDVLVSTDVIAEGMNLQQCCHVINYDLPWNPMRLVQRNGRIDRIGSTYDEVHVRCFFPDQRLNDLLDLEERLRRKIAQAAASVGMESEVIPGSATREVTFTEAREEIERLRQQDASLLENAGEDPSAHSGEEYRQELRQGMRDRGEEIKALPWAAGSGFVGAALRGYVFCARVGEDVMLRFVPAAEGEIVADRLSCLRLAHCERDTPRSLPDDLKTGAYDAWARARQDIYEKWMFATDPANLQPKVRRLFREAAEHLRQFPPPGVKQEELDRTIDALEAPWGMRQERELREVFDREAEDPQAVSLALLAKVRELGLRPYKPPEPLPVIDEEEVQLVCWLAVEAAEGAEQAREEKHAE